MLIDSHVHVWPLPGGEHPLSPRPDLADLSELPCPHFTDKELLAIGREYGIDKFNIVHKKQFQDATYLLEVITRNPETFVGTAVVDPRRRDLAAEIPRLSEAGIRALRIYPQLSESDPEVWLQDNAHAELFQLCGESDVCVACMVGPECFAEIDRMCGAHPDTAVTIDHMGLIGRSGTIDPEQLQQLCGLSHHKRLYIKLSGLYNLGEKTPPHSDLTELATVLIKSFGAERCMWGSDGPYQMLRAPNTLQTSIDFIEGLPISGTEKQWIFGKTALELYFRS